MRTYTNNRKAKTEQSGHTSSSKVNRHSIITFRSYKNYPGKRAGGIQAGSRQSHLGSQVGLAGSRLSRPGSNPGSRIPPGIQGGIPPPTRDPWWDPASHLGSKVGSRLPPGILGGIPPPTWDPRGDPASPTHGSTWDPAFHPGSLVGSRLPPGIQGGIPPVPPRVQPRIPHPFWDPMWNPASHQGSKGEIRDKSVQQS